jgi:hypothetical protein
MRLKKQEREFFRELLKKFLLKIPILGNVKWSITSYEKGSLGKRFIML